MKYITVAQLAKILKITRQSVHKKIKKGQIQVIRIGKTYAIPEDFIKNNVFDIKGHPLSEDEKKNIERAVKKTLEEYGEVLRLLGKE